MNNLPANYIPDLFSLLITCIISLYSIDPFSFKVAFGIGILLSVICWIACSFYSRLWNLRYRITWTHHLLCGIAAILTIIFTLIYTGVKYTKEAASVLIGVWQVQIKSDNSWQNSTFRKAYDAVKSIGTEDFTGFPHPDQGGTFIPASKDESRKACASVYAREAVQHFKKTHPYLSKILIADSEIPAQVIHDDVTQFFTAHGGEVYPSENAVKLAAEYIKKGLDVQIPRVVTIARIMTVILFFIFQAIPFGLIGYSAYKDLKVII